MRAKLRLSFCVSAFCILHSAFLYAQSPAWWSARGAVDPGLSAHDYSPVTLGQLKWIATKAADEMNAYFGAGADVMAVVNAFEDSGNYIVATVGQVKYVAQPFYDRLQQFELIHTFPPGMPDRRYPWPQYSSGGDYDLATVGQVKYVFSFDSAKDSDGDGLSDWQEAADRLGLSISGYVLYSGPQVGRIYVDLAANADGSGIVQRQTLSQPGVFGFDKLPTRRWYWIKAWRDSNQNGAKDFWEAQGDSVANPIYLTANVANANVPLTDPDTDNDTLADWWEIMWFGNLAQGPNDDPDGDVIINQSERHYGMDPTLTTITFANAAVIEIEPGAPRIADTTMFFPNQNSGNHEHNYNYIIPYPEYYDGTSGVNSTEDVDYSSSFGLFARPSQRPGRQATEEYQENYVDYFSDVLSGAQYKAIFFEVDLFYDDFQWGHSSLDPNNLSSEISSQDGHRFSVDLLQALYNDYNVIPVIVLLNGPDEYAEVDDDRIFTHAITFIDILNTWKIPAGYILGTEIPRYSTQIEGESPKFDTVKANRLIDRIRNYIEANHIAAGIGVHMQGGAAFPERAQFLAYEFSWNPWSGFRHGDGEPSCQNKELVGFAAEAQNIMTDYGGRGVHFLEYNYRVTGRAAKNQTLVLDCLFPSVQRSDYRICFGFSRSYSGFYDECPVCP